MTFEEIKPVLAADSWMYKDSIANNGEKETLDGMNRYVKDINDLVSSLFHVGDGEIKTTEWKLLKVAYSRGLDKFHRCLFKDAPGKEVWVIEVMGKKMGIAQFDRSDPCIVLKEDMIANAETHEAFAKTIRNDAELIDEWKEESVRLNWENL